MTLTTKYAHLTYISIPKYSARVGNVCTYVSDFRPAIETVNTLPARGLIITRHEGGGEEADNAPTALAPVRATNTKVTG